MTSAEGGESAIAPVQYRGAARLTIRSTEGLRTLPAVVPCYFDELGLEINALLDTGATYCVMRADLAQQLDLRAAAGDLTRIRHGETVYEGSLHKHPMRIPALRGHDLRTEPTWFVSEAWTGPIVLGWAGFLEGMRAFGCVMSGSPDVEDLFCFLPAHAEEEPWPNA